MYRIVPLNPASARVRVPHTDRFLGVDHAWTTKSTGARKPSFSATYRTQCESCKPTIYRPETALKSSESRRKAGIIRLRSSADGCPCPDCLIDRGGKSRTGGTLDCHFVGRRVKSEKPLRSSSLSRPINTAPQAAPAIRRPRRAISRRTRLRSSARRDGIAPTAGRAKMGDGTQPFARLTRIRVRE